MLKIYLMNTGLCLQLDGPGNIIILCTSWNPPSIARVSPWILAGATSITPGAGTVCPAGPTLAPSVPLQPSRPIYIVAVGAATVCPAGPTLAPRTFSDTRPLDEYPGLSTVILVGGWLFNKDKYCAIYSRKYIIRDVLIN